MNRYDNFGRCTDLLPSALSVSDAGQKVGGLAGLTLRVVLGVVHCEEQGERGAYGLFPAATQAAVLHLASKQFPDGRLARRAQRAVNTTIWLGLPS